MGILQHLGQSMQPGVRAAATALRCISRADTSASARGTCESRPASGTVQGSDLPELGLHVRQP